jgi:hypothetical protein
MSMWFCAPPTVLRSGCRWQAEELDEDYFHDVESGPTMTPRADVRSSSSYTWSDWWAFWSIPKVRYITHLICSIVFLVLLALMLVAPLTTIDVAGQTHKIRFRGGMYTFVEVSYWICALGRLFALVHVGYTHGLSVERLRPRDVVSMVFHVEGWITALNVGAFFCRMVVLSFQLNRFKSCEDILGAYRTFRFWDSCEHFTLHLGYVTLVETDLLLICLLLIVMRLVLDLKYFKVVGETLLILTAMIRESAGVLLLMIFSCGSLMLMLLSETHGGLPLVFPPGANWDEAVRRVTNASELEQLRQQLTVNGAPILLPAQAQRANGTFNDLATLALTHEIDRLTSARGTSPFESRLFLPVWSSVGDLEDRKQLWTANDLLPARTQFNWLPLLLIVFAFVVTMFLVNLMIAQMSTRYEYIRENSLRFRSLQLVDFTLEFKDDRGSPSPFNLLEGSLVPNAYLIRRGPGPHCATNSQTALARFVCAASDNVRAAMAGFMEASHEERGRGSRIRHNNGFEDDLAPANEGTCAPAKVRGGRAPAQGTGGRMCNV